MARKTSKDAKMGRPRGFDGAAALDAAMRVFWAKSYEGATLADLTKAMGINRSSMYAAFGDKESLYKLALARYREMQMSFFHKALERPTLREAIRALVGGTVEFLAAPGHPAGCLSLQAGLACGSDAEHIRRATIAWRKVGESAIRERMLRAQKEGDLDAKTNAADFARYVATILQGLGVQAANGATRAELQHVGEMALRLLGY